MLATSTLNYQPPDLILVVKLMSPSVHWQDQIYLIKLHESDFVFIYNKNKLTEKGKLHFLSGLSGPRIFQFTVNYVVKKCANLTINLCTAILKRTESWMFFLFLTRNISDHPLSLLHSFPHTRVFHSQFPTPGHLDLFVPLLLFPIVPLLHKPDTCTSCLYSIL